MPETITKTMYIPMEAFSKRYALQSDEFRIGGFGTVYEAIRTSDDQPVAIKYVPIENSRWEIVNGRREPREVILLAQCQAVPGVIRMYNYTMDSKGLFIAMERPSPGMDLFDFNDKHGPLSETAAREFFRQIVEIVKACAEVGVVHRDIKEENILVDLNAGRLKLIDFGSAALIEESPYSEFMGTPEHAPPECFLGQYEAIPSTVWTLGIVLYAMVNGDIPYEKPHEIVCNCLRWRTEPSGDCKDLILCCLFSTPAYRPSLEDILRHPWIADVKSPVPPNNEMDAAN